MAEFAIGDRVRFDDEFNTQVPFIHAGKVVGWVGALLDIEVTHPDPASDLRPGVRLGVLHGVEHID